MISKINLVTIWTDNIEPMKNFYNDVMGFEIINDLGEYVEFKNEGVRFALCERKVMVNFSDEYKIRANGQRFELAFPCESVEDVDHSYMILLDKGAVGVKSPQNMPWNQRTALFKDPDGNIHELFVDLE
ncbi:MAG: VOC family protein [Dethiosulfatibacter sp.]|nr:VOC family protein [Dethiosulfatibacter sp.]